MSEAVAKMVAEHGLDGIVCIPRAQYEALMYAARILRTERPGHPAFAALRAAGVEMGEVPICKVTTDTLYVEDEK